MSFATGTLPTCALVRCTCPQLLESTLQLWRRPIPWCTGLPMLPPFLGWVLLPLPGDFIPIEGVVTTRDLPPQLGHNGTVCQTRYRLVNVIIAAVLLQP